MLVEVFAPAFVNRLLAPGFDAETGRLTVTLTRIMLIQPLILSVGSVATAVLNNRNQFLLTGLSVVSHNVALIAGIVAARLVPGLGIYGPSLGVVAGLAIPAVAALFLLGRPTIRILFERGKFTPAAGDLTYSVLTIYAIALPAYVATEVITRGLIALRDTRTPLMTNIFQLTGRAVIMALFIAPFGVLVIPAALAVTATLETLMLAAVLFVKMRRRASAAHRLSESPG